MNLAPIVLFIYNRPKHTKATLDSLIKNPLAKFSTIYIYSDGAKNSEDEKWVNEVRQIIRTLSGFKEIVIFEKEKNDGLANSVISGVTEVINKWDKVIVLEDDLVLATDFLDYMNHALEFYKDTPSIFSVSGYLFPIKIPKNYAHNTFLLPRSCSWGWGTWKNKWELADWEIKDFENFAKNSEQKTAFNQGGADLTYMLIKQKRKLINSWAIRWYYTHFKNKAYCVYPTKSKVANIGFDGSGTHCNAITKYDVPVYEGNINFTSDLLPDPRITKELQRFFKPSLYRKTINRIKFGAI
jgi:hypothetical protein